MPHTLNLGKIFSVTIGQHAASPEHNNTHKQESSAATGLTWQAPKSPSPTFIDIMDYLKRDHVIKTAIDTLAEASVGHGGEWSVNTDNPTDTKILELAKDWADRIDQDTFHQTVSTELWATGNTIWEQLIPTDLTGIVHVPIGTIQQIHLNPEGTKIQAYDQILPTGVGIKQLKKIDRYMHWRWNTVHSDLIGEGLIAVLLRRGKGYTWTDAGGTDHTSYRPSYQQCTEEMDDSLRKAVRKMVPRTHYLMEGFTNAERVATAATLGTLAPEENAVLNTEQKDKQHIEITQTAFDNRSRLDPIIDHFFNGKVIAMQTPTIQLLMEGGYTEASSRTAMDAVDRKIEAFQRFIKRKDEQELFKPYILQNGVTEEELRKSRLRWNWAPVEKPKYSLTEIIQLLQVQMSMYAQQMITQPIIPPEAVTRMLINAGVPITAEQQKNTQMKQPPQQQQQQHGETPVTTKTNQQPQNKGGTPPNEQQ